MLSIYCAHQITGLSGQEVFDYYEHTKHILEDYGYDVFLPVIGKKFLENESSIKSQGYTHNPLATNHFIYTRDKWMVKKCDILYANLAGMTNASIGCCMELAWAADNGKHVIVVMEDDNIHNHCFISESANAIFNNTDDALHYLYQLSMKEI